MQNNNKTALIAKIPLEKTWILVKIIILGFVIYFVWDTFKYHNTDFKEILIQWKQLIISQNLIQIVCVLILGLINWALEAKKWQILVNQIEEISFLEAYRGVLLGLSMGFVSPFNLGDFAGKLWQLNSQNRSKSIGAVLMGNMIQTYITLFFGTIGFTYFVFIVISQLNLGQKIVIFCCILGVVLGIILVFYRKKLPALLNKLTFLKRFQKYFIIISQYSISTILEVLFWGVTRYAVFTLQFYLIIGIFQINLPIIPCLMVISLVFLAKTIIPAFSFLSDLGIREMTALYFFHFFRVNPSAVVAATFSLWIINMLLPVAVGTGFILFLKNKNPFQ